MFKTCPDARWGKSRPADKLLPNQRWQYEYLKPPQHTAQPYRANTIPNSKVHSSLETLVCAVCPCHTRHVMTPLGVSAYLERPVDPSMGQIQFNSNIHIDYLIFIWILSYLQLVSSLQDLKLLKTLCLCYLCYLSYLSLPF